MTNYLRRGKPGVAHEIRSEVNTNCKEDAKEHLCRDLKRLAKHSTAALHPYHFAILHLNEREDDETDCIERRH